MVRPRIMRTVAPYDVFARVYEQESHADIPRRFFATVRGLLCALPRGARVLDLGCGTGLLSTRIAAMGHEVVGVDHSREMLALARTRCRSHGGAVSFVRSGLDVLPRRAGFAAAVACGDVVNHLPSLAYFRRMCARIRGNLVRDGCFLFDTLNEFCFRTYWNNCTYLMEGRHGDLVMECEWDPPARQGTARVVAYVRRGSAGIEKRVTVLIERYYDDEELLGTLRGAGFADVWWREWSPWPRQLIDGQLDRGLWCAWVGSPLAKPAARRLSSLGFRRLP